MSAMPLLITYAVMATLAVPARADTNSSPSISLEGIYWRPAGLDFPVINAGTPNTNLSGASQGISYDFSPGYHLAVKWKSFRASWIDLQTQSDFSASCPPGTGNCMKSVQRGSSGELGSTGAASAYAWSATRLQLFDLDFLKSVGAASDSTFTTLIGIRYARIYNGTDTFYVQTPAETDAIQSRVVNTMTGLRAGISAEYDIRAALRLSASAAISLLSGSSHSDATESGPSKGASQSGATYNTISRAIELGLKMTYSPLNNCDAWLGYEFLEFGDGIVENSMVGGANSSQFSTEVTRQTISFMGPTMGLRWRF